MTLDAEVFESHLRAYLLTLTDLTDLVGDRIYGIERLTVSALPAVTYQNTSGTAGYTLTGSDGTRTTHINFNCWASQPATFNGVIGSASVALAIENAFLGKLLTIGSFPNVTAFVENVLTNHDEDVGLYRHVVMVKFTYPIR